jgi:hypothetical protein
VTKKRVDKDLSVAVKAINRAALANVPVIGTTIEAVGEELRPS